MYHHSQNVLYVKKVDIGEITSLSSGGPTFIRKINIIGEDGESIEITLFAHKKERLRLEGVSPITELVS